jgi:hypothetical protein
MGNKGIIGGRRGVGWYLIGSNSVVEESVKTKFK